MTKSQIWVAAFLVLFVALFFLERLTNSNSESGQQQVNPMPQSEMSSQELSGADLVSRLGCSGCHGADLSGSRMGPNLHKVSQYWTRDKLINYLRNPSSYMDSERFQAYKMEYPGMMPSFNNIGIKDLGKVADYLLQLK